MTCQICFEERDLEKGPYKCEIDHFFCQSCIDKWNNRPCPICRSEPVNDNINRHGNEEDFSMTIHYSDAGLLTGWNALNRNNFTTRRGLRPTRSRTQMLSILSAMDSFDSDDIQIIYDTFENDINRSTIGRRNAIVSSSPIDDIITPTNTIFTNTITTDTSVNWQDRFNELYRHDRLNSIYGDMEININNEINRDIENENNTNVIQRSTFMQTLLNYFDIDRYIL
jgi:hypothetical protein